MIIFIFRIKEPTQSSSSSYLLLFGLLPPRSSLVSSFLFLLSLPSLFPPRLSLPSRLPLLSCSLLEVLLLFDLFWPLTFFSPLWYSLSSTLSSEASLYLLGLLIWELLWSLLLGWCSLRFCSLRGSCSLYLLCWFLLLSLPPSCLFFLLRTLNLFQFLLCERFFHFISREPWIKSWFFLVFLGGISCQLDDNLRVLLLIKISSLELFGEIFKDLDSLEFDDHSEPGNSLVDLTGNFKGQVEAVERAVEIKVLVPLLAK